MRRKRATKFSDIDRTPAARAGKERFRLNHAPRHVDRWHHHDEIIFWTWRDLQREHFAIRTRRRFCRVAVVVGSALIIAVTILLKRG